MINNDYIPDDDNRGMTEAMQEIVNQGKKVKVYGNEFDFGRLKQDRIIGVNGNQVKARVKYVVAGKDHFLRIWLKEPVEVYMHNKKIKTRRFNLNPDMSIRDLSVYVDGYQDDKETSFQNIYFSDFQNCYSLKDDLDDYEKDGSYGGEPLWIKNLNKYSFDLHNNEALDKIVDCKQNASLQIYDRIKQDLQHAEIKLLNELFKRDREQRDIHVYDVIFDKNAAYVCDKSEHCTYLYKKTEGENEYQNGKTLIQRQPHDGSIGSAVGSYLLNGGDFCFIVRPQKHQLIVVDKHCERVITNYNPFQERSFALGERMFLSRFAGKNPNRVNMVNEADFDKMLKKYFDKCVLEQKEKDRKTEQGLKKTVEILQNNEQAKKKSFFENFKQRDKEIIDNEGNIDDNDEEKHLSKVSNLKLNFNNLNTRNSRKMQSNSEDIPDSDDEDVNIPEKNTEFKFDKKYFPSKDIKFDKKNEKPKNESEDIKNLKDDNGNNKGKNK